MNRSVVIGIIFLLVNMDQLIVRSCKPRYNSLSRTKQQKCVSMKYMTDVKIMP